MNQALAVSIQISMLDRIKAYLQGWWKRYICDDFDAHYPNEPWLFDYEIVEQNGEKYLKEH